MNKAVAMRVLVTGGGTGIGLAIARHLRQSGARIHLCDIAEDVLKTAMASLPDSTATLADVACEADVARLFQDIEDRLGGLDVLINNAGIAGPTAPVESTSLADWQRTLDVNLTGTFLCTRAAVPLLKSAGGGAIINIASAAARLGFPNRSPYSASKWGVIGLTQTWAMELGAARIRVNAILPGIVEGDRQDRVLQAQAALEDISYDEMKRRRLESVSLRTMVTADEIAAMVAYLCSPAARSISGQSFGICGHVESLR